MIRESPNLRNLTCSWDSVHGRMRPYTGVPIPLNSLETVSFSGDYSILEHLTAPSLGSVSLTVMQNFSGSMVVAAMITRSQCSLHSLVLDQIWIHGNSLLEILHVTPTLHTLTIADGKPNSVTDKAMGALIMNRNCTVALPALRNLTLRGSYLFRTSTLLDVLESRIAEPTRVQVVDLRLGHRQYTEAELDRFRALRQAAVELSLVRMDSANITDSAFFVSWTHHGPTMTSSKSRIIGGALNILHDVSNGSNIPGFEPVVNLAGAKRNKLESRELACDVHDTVKQILRVFPTLSNDATLVAPGLYDDGLRKFQQTLERVAAIVERIGQQSRLGRFLNQHDDKEELLRCGKKIMDAKVQFLLLAELAKSDARQREQYPVFVEADLDLLEVLSPANKAVYTREIARLVPHRKEVVVRRYRNRKRFLEDIEHLSRFRHPNFAFLGASTMMCVSPFVVMEHMVYRPAQEGIENLYQGSPRILQQTALAIVTDVFDSTTWLNGEKMTSIQYTGRKVILNIDAIPHQPTHCLQKHLSADLHATVMAAALRPIYQYCHGASVNLHDLRRIREQLRTQSDQLFDLRASLLATGNLEYEIFTHVEADDAVEPGTVAYFDSNAGGRLVAVCNILAELQEHGLASLNPFITMHTDGELLIGDDP
ncbi:hypothetical protein C8R47DRAFT_1285280 [Mycena vitilis]|nr:hypothetical protein C8R47DRAFT_1285280 [Mycena vitilis]